MSERVDSRSRREVLEDFNQKAGMLGWRDELVSRLNKLGVTLEEVFNVRAKSRMGYIIAGRHFSWAFARDRLPDWSWTSLGRLFGVDHTTFMSAMDKFKIGATLRETRPTARKKRKKHG